MILLLIWFVGLSAIRSDGQVSGKIVFTSKRDARFSDIYIMDADGRNQTNLTQDPSSDFQPHILPYSQRIVFISDRFVGSDLFTINTDGSDLRMLLDSGPDTGATILHPAWSPDGNQVAFSRFPPDTEEAWEGWDIYAINVGDTTLIRLTDHRFGDTKPTWSPDGQSILFQSGRDGAGYYKMDRSGSNEMLLTENAGATPLKYSPDGTMLIFADWFAATNDQQDIAIMNADGSDLRIIVDHPANDTDPTWSPDGRHIAFSSDRDGDFEIYTMDIDGNNLVQLTHNESVDEWPIWITGAIATPIEEKAWGEIKRNPQIGR